MIEQKHLKALEKVGKEYPDAELFCLSLDKHERRFGRIRALPWDKGLKAIGLG